jgi:ADP-ribosylglycohydrolase
MKGAQSKVMTIANKLVAQGYNRSNAMRKAWALVKMDAIETKTAGVTFGNRQKAIEHLAQYRPQDIIITLRRERENAHDANAIAVVAAVTGKGSYTMDYVPKALAQFLAPLMDSGKHVNSWFREVRGMYAPYMNYGLAITIRI